MRQPRNEAKYDSITGHVVFAIQNIAGTHVLSLAKISLVGMSLVEISLVEVSSSKLSPEEVFGFFPTCVSLNTIGGVNK